MKTVFVAYSKEKLIEMIKENMNDNDIAIFSTGLKKFRTSTKQKLSFLEFQVPHEMLNEPEDIRGLVLGNTVFSLIIVGKPEQSLSGEYIRGLKENGFFGFTLE